MPEPEAPVFAVVGHPNKGKSSIVATLAEDDSVPISSTAGTTTVARRFTAATGDGRTLYALVDTPGFQRARRALDWMRQRETTAAEHPAIVRQFVREHANDPKHRDEVELLRPIVEGAAILYVVDGSTPFGPEYEPEMEILRWTGRPSMALINPIGQASHVDAWRDALGQYFRVVRVFNAVQAEFDKRVALLEAFGQLDESWRQPMQQAVGYLRQQRARRRDASADAVAAMLLDILAMREQKKLEQHEQPGKYREQLEANLRKRIRSREHSCRQQIHELYRHRRLQLEEQDFELLDKDLFSEDTWTTFGLSRADLMKVAMLGGALAGGASGVWLDVATGGSSLLAGAVLGSLAGGVTGAVGAWWTSDQLAKVRVFNQPLGGKLLECGPVQNLNVPFVLLGRAVAHQQLVANRTHAAQGIAQITPPADWSEAQKRQFSRLFQQALRGKVPADRLADDLKRELTPLLAG